MIVLSSVLRGQVACWSMLALGFLGRSARADWQKDATSIAWKNGDKTVWRFSYDPTKGKVFFDPVSVGGGPALTNFKPVDHPWHYGLWFSWKYINHVNYWEEGNPTTGNSVGNTFGKTTWKTPAIDTKPDGSAVIKLDVAYTDNKGVVVMTEERELNVSAPGIDGSYAIDWNMHFTAGAQNAVLDRTPLIGEPQGAVNGGYAGLSIRMAAQPLQMAVMTPAGPVTDFPNSRARPNSPIVGCNFSTKEGKDIGAVAIISDPANIREDAPWYIINDDTTNKGEGFRFICAAILAPKIMTVPANGKLNLHYRVALSPTAWTADSLKSARDKWMAASK